MIALQAPAEAAALPAGYLEECAEWTVTDATVTHWPRSAAEFHLVELRLVAWDGEITFVELEVDRDDYRASPCGPVVVQYHLPRPLVLDRLVGAAPLPHNLTEILAHVIA